MNILFPLHKWLFFRLGFVLMLAFVVISVIVPPALADNGETHDKPALFAGGCFWCMEEAFEEAEGVTEVISGYTGGETPDPTYKQVASGRTSHFEAVKVIYNPAKTSYRYLLAVFWRNIDPHDGEGQFCDKGDQYKAAIFYQNERERQLANESKSALIQSGILNPPIATKIISAGNFYTAEARHQNYYKTHSVRYGFYKSLCGRESRLKEVWGDAPVKKVLTSELEDHKPAKPE